MYKYKYHIERYVICVPMSLYVSPLPSRNRPGPWSPPRRRPRPRPRSAPAPGVSAPAMGK